MQPSYSVNSRVVIRIKWYRKGTLARNYEQKLVPHPSLNSKLHIVFVYMVVGTRQQPSIVNCDGDDVSLLIAIFNLKSGDVPRFTWCLIRRRKLAVLTKFLVAERTDLILPALAEFHHVSMGCCTNPAELRDMPSILKKKKKIKKELN